MPGPLLDDGACYFEKREEEVLRERFRIFSVRRSMARKGKKTKRQRFMLLFLPSPGALSVSSFVQAYLHGCRP